MLLHLFIVYTIRYIIKATSACVCFIIASLRPCETNISLVLIYTPINPYYFGSLIFSIDYVYDRQLIITLLGYVHVALFSPCIVHIIAFKLTFFAFWTFFCVPLHCALSSLHRQILDGFVAFRALSVSCFLSPSSCS